MEPDITCVIDCYANGLFDVFSVPSAVVLALITRQWRYVPVAAAIAWLIGEVLLPSAFFGFTEALRWTLIALPYGWQTALTNYVTLLIIVAFVFGLKHSIVTAANGRGTLGLRIYASGAALVVAGLLVFAGLYALAPSLLPKSFRAPPTAFADESMGRCTAASAVPVAGLPRFKTTAQRSAGVRQLGPLNTEQLALPLVYTTQMLVEHRLGFPQRIRVDDPSRYDASGKVALMVAVSERGDVVAATPYDGPKELYGRAVAIASAWKFVPFKRDGQAIPVRILRTAVEIAGPEGWWPLPLQYPDFTDLDAVTIRLARYDFEQAMALEIRGDGAVTFRGSGSRIALQGKHCALIDRATVAALVKELQRTQFFALLPYYSDSRAGFSVSIAIGEFAHNVVVSGTGEDSAPEVLLQLTQSILDAVHAERWISGDRFTGSTLTAEGWKFKEPNQENSYMLAHVARVGEEVAVADLLALGAQITLHDESNEIAVAPGPAFPNPDPVRTVLEEAANAGAFDTVKILLAAPVQWPKDAVSGAYISAIEYGNDEVAQILIERGADRRAKGMRKKTALAAAATSGLPDLVARELTRSAGVNEGDINGFTPLHWAAGTDYLKTVDSTCADRAKVIKLLLDAGAKVNARATYLRWTPLHSNWMGLPEVTSTLIANGADVNAQDEDGNTPLMLSKSAESVRLLLAAGANPYLRNGEGRNALEVARADAFGGEISRVLERWMATHPERK